jgi:hypothetical protein
MSERLEDFEDVSVYAIEDERREALLGRGRECAVVWSTRDGWPIGVMHIYLWRKGRFWVTCTEQRKRVSALRRCPKSSIIVAFEGEQTITAKTLATVHEPGHPHAGWFYPALAELVLPDVAGPIRDGGVDGFVERLESEHRVIIEFEPVKWISFDGRRVGAHASGRWKPGTPWIEPDEAGT